MSPDQFVLLTTALRGRTRDAADLAELLGWEPGRVAAVLGELDRENYIDFDGTSIFYHLPDRRIAEHVVGELDAERARFEQTIGRVRELAEQLPPVMQNWWIGESSHAYALRVETIHAPHAGDELWLRQVKRGLPARSDWVLPAGLPLSDASASFDQRRLDLVADITAAGGEVRWIVTPEVIADREQGDRLMPFREAGVALRVLPDPPSWFWLHDREVACIPLEWGASAPTSASRVEDRAIATAVGALFDRLWDAAQELDSEAGDWVPLLRLMREGATLETAARVLGISSRTAGRRVSAAMDHYGAHTLFGLGAAWGRAGG
ncbi:hypothetical protein [Microbacterium sp.]|uniref:hypothetical protein n=1 Tax=Microbacterium sp. TaxID=51671 RepID=UPI003C75363C